MLELNNNSSNEWEQSVRNVKNAYESIGVNAIEMCNNKLIQYPVFFICSINH